VSSGVMAVNHQALGAKGGKFNSNKRSKLFKRLTTSWVARPTPLNYKKIKRDVKDPLRM